MEKPSLEKFFIENESLIHFASQKALRRFAAAGLGDDVNYDDVYGQLREVFVKSYRTYDHEKAKFSTYFVTAATNAITNEISRLYRQVKCISASQSYTGDGDEDSPSLFDVIGGVESGVEDQLALESELQHLQETLSPLAKLLLSYSINPPDFIKQEFFAQRAQCTFATSIGFKTSHASEIDIRFIANCLRATVEDPKSHRFIDSAVNEVKEAVMQAVRN